MLTFGLQKIVANCTPASFSYEHPPAPSRTSIVCDTSIDQTVSPGQIDQVAIQKQAEIARWVMRLTNGKYRLILKRVVQERRFEVIELLGSATCCFRRLLSKVDVNCEREVAWWDRQPQRLGETKR